VRGLTAADFTVLENGIERPIKAFTPIEVASRTRTTETAWSSTIPPDVGTNAVSEQDGRLVIILLDRTIPPQQPTITARRIATAAVDALGPNDLAAVVSTNNGAVQNLTADRTRLLRAINASDLASDISDEAKGIFAAMGVKLDPLGDGRCLCGLCVLETIERVADAVRSAPRRRKLLLFIGSSVVWQSMRPTADRAEDVGCDYRLEHARNAMFAAVDRANLTIHSIDPQGLISVGPQTRASIPNAVTGRGGPAGRLQQQQDDMTRTMSSQQSLQVLPERTGGRTVVSRNDPEEVVPEIYRESDAYYVLGVEAASTNRRDNPRSIEVKVARKGANVYAQRQYLAPLAQAGTAPEPQMSSTARSPLEALNRLLPTGSVPLTLSVTPMANGENRKALVRVNLDVRAFAHSDGSSAPLDIAIVTVDPTGRPLAAARQTSTISGSPPAAAVSSDINVQSQFELPPGEYGIRIAVSDQTRSAVASVFADLTVPEFDKEELSLSGIAVDIASTAAGSPAPTTRRTFRRTDRVRALVQIYQGTTRHEPIVPVSMRVQILDAKGSAVRDQSLPFGEDTFTNRRADCIITLPLATLPPGQYALKLEASMDRRTAGRALRFAIE
jgi:VWFA-related protein